MSNSFPAHFIHKASFPYITISLVSSFFPTSFHFPYTLLTPILHFCKGKAFSPLTYSIIIIIILMPSKRAIPSVPLNRKHTRVNLGDDSDTDIPSLKKQKATHQKQPDNVAVTPSLVPPPIPHPPCALVVSWT